jgi:hypothetical protein
MVEQAIIERQRQRADAAKQRRDIEGPLHRQILRYLRMTLPASWIIHHSANKPRSMRQGAREKLLGAIAGWPDLAIYGPGPAGPSAWFMEIKPPRGRVSDDQHDVHDQLLDAGFPVRVIRSVEEARAAVYDWGLPSNDAAIVGRAS